MDLLIRLILLLVYAVLALFVGVQRDTSVSPNPDSPPEDTARVPILIDDVQVQLTRSIPAQATLIVNGTIQDGCEFPIVEEIQQGSNTVIVEIYRNVQTDVMCPMNIVPYESTIDLGTFEQGSYTVDVNGTLVTFDV